jgi:hypothetical protein
VTPLTHDEERELCSVRDYIQQQLHDGRSHWHGDKHKVSGLVKMLAFNLMLKEIVNEQDNQGLPETSGSGSSGDADERSGKAWP